MYYSDPGNWSSYDWYGNAYTADYEQDDQDYMDHMEDMVKKRRLVSIPILVIKVLVYLSYIIVSLRCRKLRRDTGRWPQLYTVCLMLLMVLIEAVYDIQFLLRLPGVCQTLLPISDATDVMLIMGGVLLTTIERMVGVIRKDPDVPGFNKLASAITLVLLTLVALVLVTVLHVVGGGIESIRYATHDTVYCIASSSDYLLRHLWAFGYVMEALSYITLLLTIVLIILFLVTRCKLVKTFPLGRVVPVVVANVGLSVLLTLEFTINYSVPDFWVGKDFQLSYVFVALVWMLGDPEVRRAFSHTFCACCCNKERDEEKEELLESGYPKPLMK